MVKVHRVRRYEIVERSIEESSGIELITVRDNKKKQEFSVFNSMEDAEKYWNYWLNGDKEALQ